MPKHHIFTLPQELQDIIFSYAYARPPVLHHLINAHSLSFDKKVIPRFTPLTHTIDKWLISKRWFIYAARAYAESAAVLMTIETLTSVPTKMAVLHAFATTMSACPRDLMRARKSQFPRLRRLSLVPVRLRSLQWDVTTLGDEELRGLEVYRPLVRWLTQCQEGIVYESVRVRVDKSGEEKTLRDEEVEILMKLARAEVKSRKKSWEGTLKRVLDSTMPWSGSKDEQRLYHSSRVRADGCSLIPKEWGVMLQDCLRLLGLRSWGWWLPDWEEVCIGMAGLVLISLSKIHPTLDTIVNTLVEVVFFAGILELAIVAHRRL